MKQEQTTSLSASMDNKINFTNTYQSSEEQSTTTTHQEMSHDVYNCPVCLDPLDSNTDTPRMLMATVCNHTFPLGMFVALQGFTLSCLSV